MTLLTILIFNDAGVYAAYEEPITSIQHGVADLSRLDQPIDTISLEGEWIFYPNQLLTPDQIELGAGQHQYIETPEPWTNQTKDKPWLSEARYGTYYLKFSLSTAEINREKAIYISELASAYKVWVDGKLLGGIGQVGMTLEGEIPQSRSRLYFFVPMKTEPALVIQASNFQYRSEGPLRAIQYGESDEMISYMIKNRLTAALTIGGLFVIGLYLLIIYAIRRKDVPTLYIGLLAINMSIRGWMKDTYLVFSIHSSISWETIVKLDYITGHMGYLLLVIIIMHMFPEEMNRKAAYWSTLCSALFILFIAATPAHVYTSTLSLQFVIMFLFSIYTIAYVCILAATRKREGAKLYIIGYLGIAAASINDVLLYQRMIQTNELLYEAIFLFILLQAVIMSYRHSRLFENNIMLSNDLLQLNQTLEHKVEERTADLHQKNIELAQMHLSRTEMLANISHDMGSPLTGIQMNLQLLKDGLVNAQQQPAFLQSLLDKSTYVKRLNDDLFELSLLESGQLGFQFKKMELKRYMESAIHRLSLDLASQHIVLQVNRLETTSQMCEAIIHVDPARINQVLDNYVGNAVKFGGGQLTHIELNCYITSQHMAVIEVMDHGPGIEEEYLPYVFNRFYRKTQGNASGSGLGLAIVKEIIERHEGTVDVASKLGEGSLFSFSLPIHVE